MSYVWETIKAVTERFTAPDYLGAVGMQLTLINSNFETTCIKNTAVEHVSCRYDQSHCVGARYYEIVKFTLNKLCKMVWKNFLLVPCACHYD